MEKIAILGRGIIGSSWAVVFARAGHSVAIWDRKREGSETVLAPARRILDGLRGTALAGPAEAARNLSSTDDPAALLADAAFIQESVPEDLALKRSVIALVESHADDSAIIASSTSAIVPSALAQAMRNPERLIVAHPLTPPHLLPVTEIVASSRTAPRVIEQTEALMRRVGQHPIRIKKEVGGFALNRVLGAMLNELFHLIAEDVLDPDDADAGLTQGFGLRWACMGPLAAMDLNAPDGIAGYLRRYGHLSRAVAEERGAKPGLSEEVIRRLDLAMRAKHPLSAAEERKRARDQAVAKLRAARVLVT